MTSVRTVKFYNMKELIEETTRLMIEGTLPKKEADKILLALHDVSISEGDLCDYCEEERTLNKNKVCCKCTAMLYPNRN